MNDELAKELGFEDAEEFFSMVSNVDVSSNEKLAAFKKWQDEDGSKSGLEALR